jgi:type II secretion system protein N
VTEPNASAVESTRMTLSKAFGIPTIVILILIFMILGFPWDSLARRIAFEISVASGSQVSIHSLAPALTARGPVLRARDVQIAHAAVGRVHLRELEIAPRWSTSWFKAEPKLRVWADSELGLVDGVLELGASPSFVGLVSRVELSRLPLRLDASGVGFSGMLEADTNVSLKPDGTLQGRVAFTSPSLVLESTMLPMAIPFSQADGVIVILENGGTQIESLTVKGEVIEGQLSGVIELARRSESPPIDLSAELHILDPTLRRLAPGIGLAISPNGEIAVKLRGTLDAPEITPLAGRNPGQVQGRKRPARTRQ